MQTFTTPDGTELAYRVTGDGPPLVCVPGGPGQASAYLGDLGGLTAYRALVLLDNRGTGASAAPADPATYRISQLAEDIEALRIHLGYERVDLLGHSAGGGTAMLYAAAYPDRVGRLILASPSLRVTGLPSGLGADAVIASRAGEPWHAEAVRALTAEAGDADELWRLRYASAPFLYGEWNAVTQAQAGRERAEFAPEAEAGFYAEFDVDGAAVLAELAKLGDRVLIIGGDLDIWPTREALAALNTQVPGSRHVTIPEAGHFPWLDNPAAFASAVDGGLHVRPAGTTAEIKDWQHVHNAIIPADALSLEEVRERVTRNRLDVAYAAGTIVGCSTVRPPAEPGAPAIVIARVLAEHRGQGFGTEIHHQALAHAREVLGAEAVETIVWVPNTSGLRFAAANGYTEETDRYQPEGEEGTYLTLRLTS
ncbi:alpha/beta fold hydrolase [Longispora albida]|uniref:alpha/beta fold hydrolase n=1 Tax=Longispora albida TaxID=203523 RepID=UPI0003710CB7|nr:alpha/beta fold hydrolase [Longispora albida]